MESKHYFNLAKGLSICNDIMLINVKSGNVRIWLNGTYHTASQGATLLIMPSSVYRITTPVSSLVEITEFDCAYVYKMGETTLQLMNPILYDDFDRSIEKAFENKDNDYLVSSIVNDIIATFYHSSKTIDKNEKLCNFMLECTRYIEDNYTRDVNIEELSLHLGLASHYVSSLFNKVFGMTFLALVNEKRIRLATKYMLENDMSINDIAQKCGYSSIRSFNRNFSIVMGMTPTEYKSQIN